MEKITLFARISRKFKPSVTLRILRAVLSTVIGVYRWILLKMLGIISGISLRVGDVDVFFLRSKVLCR